ncbi:hypothetical protein L211DRAFT_845770 [Terfezia boudieri ATCC MYA-4762]|uniref:Uncharacterized protein n=1 Tax=Terfezia boudieri ATCC MYA-4762 TaxID=1051890 RepID=A0A3N4M302_9PEZI|nr:hypothetical protein L211DRAFT_845770 [Terfezia boudieri ATCC MYA-4762]
MAIETIMFSVGCTAFPKSNASGGGNMAKPQNLSDPGVEAPYGAESSSPLFPPNTGDNCPFDGHSFAIEYLNSIEPRFCRDGYSVYIEYANRIIKYGARKNLAYEIKKGEDMKKALIQAAWEHYRAWAEEVRLRRKEVREGENWKEGCMEEAWNVEREMGELCRQMGLIDWQREAQELGHPACWVFEGPIGELSEVMPSVNCYLGKK